MPDDVPGPASPEISQQRGYVHAGATIAVADERTRVAAGQRTLICVPAEQR